MRRSVKEIRQPERYIPSSFCQNFSLSISDDDRRTTKEAVDSDEGKLLKEAMVDEMASLDKNEVWGLVVLSTGRKPIGIKLVFKKKMNSKGKVEKYKASIRLLLSIFVAFDFEVKQMDVKTTFLHMNLEEEIYMNQPEGFAVNGKK